MEIRNYQELAEKQKLLPLVIFSSHFVCPSGEQKVRKSYCSQVREEPGHDRSVAGFYKDFRLAISENPNNAEPGKEFTHVILVVSQTTPAQSNILTLALLTLLSLLLSLCSLSSHSPVVFSF